MHKGLKSAMLIAGSIIAIEVLAADSGSHAQSGFGVHRYCIRLLGEHAAPVASKQIVVSTDDEARELAAQFLNDYDKGLGPDAVAFPFIVVEGHPCVDEIGSASDGMPKHRHHHHHHHHKVEAAAKPPAA